MPKKSRPKTRPKTKHDAEPELWIRPNLSLKGDRGERAWGNRSGGIPNSSRILELADLALGLKKPETPKKRASAGIHPVTKSEPYST